MVRERPHGRVFAVLFAALAVAGLTACSSPAGPTPNPGAPSLTCPADVAATAPDAAGATVSYQVPTAYGGDAPVSVNCLPPSGSRFAVGSTPVSCTATDRSYHATTCSFAVRVTLPPKLRATRFMAFGDSMTAGEVTSPLAMKLVVLPAASYPTRLQSAMTARYTTQTVTMSNAGLPAEATASGISRLQGLLSSSPEVVLLMEGANDLFGGDPATVAPAASNVRTMVLVSKRAGASVFLANLPPQREGGTKAKGFALVPVFNASLSTIALQENVPLVDVYAAFGGTAGSYIGVDGLHPNEAGYQKIADTFFESIRSKLEIPGVETGGASASPRIILEPGGLHSARPVQRAADRSPSSKLPSR